MQTPDLEGTGAATLAAPVAPSFSQKIKYGLKSPYFWANWTVVLALIVSVIVFWALSPDTFLTPYNIATILTAAAVPAILVIGQAFVVMTAGIDLSNAAILTLSAVSFGAMFAAGQPLALCILVAFVVGREPRPTAEALRDHLAERLVRYKIPGVIRLVDALPKTVVGKTDKTRLRSQARETVGA